MIDQILSQQGGFNGAETKTANDVLGKDAFLKLLVTQLQNQDPLNPLDDKEFIAQLAQFSSLEQMSNVAAGITALTEKTAQQDMLSAVNYIGKEVTMGIRPENIHERSERPQADPAQVVKATVEVVEMMGSEVYLYASTGKSSFTARVQASCRKQIGDPVEVVLDMDKLHFFGGADEKALL